MGNRIAERLGGYFSQRFAICNGLVEGIDEHSIYVNGKVVPNAIGIISGGLCYKSTCSQNHIRVVEDVLKAGGLIISEYPPTKKRINILEVLQVEFKLDFLQVLYWYKVRLMEVRNIH